MPSYPWYIEGYFDAKGVIKKLALESFPQVLGRDPSLNLALSGASISRRHALLNESNGLLIIEDLKSSNGTFVNRNRISAPTILHHGDIIHMGEIEIRIIDRRHATEPGGDISDDTRLIGSEELSEIFPNGVRELEELLEKHLVLPVYQPVIAAKSLNNCGYELLGRGAHPKLPVNPLPLFNLAESFGLEVKLSEVFREVGIKEACTYKLGGPILVNTHPSEMKNIDRLLMSLESLVEQYPQCEIMLEIHEHAVTDDIHLLQKLKAELQKLKIKLAFDDFGVGQSRLVEMVAAKPDLIKFDRALIQDIDTADPSRVNLLKHLEKLAKEFGIETLAECVGTEAEYKSCAQIDFNYYQGFYFCKPEPAGYFNDLD